MSEHVLIIDDDEDFARLLSVYLSRAGFRTTIAPDGIQGQMAANRSRPDVIVLDYQMPAASGVTVAARLRRSTLTGGIPVVMLTGHKTQTLTSTAMAAGVAAVVSKNDLTEDLLLRTLRTALDGNMGTSVDLDALFPIDVT